MASLLFISLLILSASWIFAPTAQALQTVPYKLNFQGRLTDNNGNAKAAGSYNIKFRLMSASSGGSNLWQADRVRGASDYRVTVTTGGLFSVQLGDTTLGDPALSPSIFNTQTNATVYLEVELPTPATATCSTNGCASFTEGAMTPRSLVGSSAYAMNADTIDGIDSASFVQLSSNNTFTGTFLHKNSSNTTTAFQIQKADGTPLLVADTSNLALKVGGGDVSPDASPALFVLDYKNTSGDPTGTDGAMYYNSNSGKFRCYEDGVWKNCRSEARTRFEMHNEFMAGSTVTYGTNSTTYDGTLFSKLGDFSGAIAFQAGELNHPGILRFTVGSGASGNELAVLTSSLDSTQGIVFGSDIWTNSTMLRIPSNLSDGTNTYVTFNGFMDGVSSAAIAPNNGCYLKYSHGVNSGKWQGVCESANTESTCDTGVTVATTRWYNLATTVNAAGNSVTFAVYDPNAGTTSTCTVTSNIPTAGVSIVMGFTTTAGSSARTVDYDYTETIGEGVSR